MEKKKKTLHANVPSLAWKVSFINNAEGFSNTTSPLTHSDREGAALVSTNSGCSWLVCIKRHKLREVLAVLLLNFYCQNIDILCGIQAPWAIELDRTGWYIRY